MKAFLHFPKHFLQVCLLLLCITGCIKEPGPDIPSPPRKPAWLLTKFIQVTGHGDEVLGPIYGEYYYYKTVDEYHYNQFYKPVLRLSYHPAIEKDTTSMVLSYKDTLIYDRLQRVTVVKQIYSYNKVYSMKKFAYRGNDTLPCSLERYYYDSLGNPIPRLDYVRRYEYLGDTVLDIRQDPKRNDTVRYIYRQGNFTSRCYNSYCEDVYISYAGGPNVGLFLNLSHGLALEIPDTQESPLISRESWQQTSNPEHTGRYVVFNEHNLPVMARWRNYIPEYVVTNRFEYMKVE